jgi:hypothetical protein
VPFLIPFVDFSLLIKGLLSGAEVERVVELTIYRAYQSHLLVFKNSNHF